MARARTNAPAAAPRAATASGSARPCQTGGTLGRVQAGAGGLDDPAHPGGQRRCPGASRVQPAPHRAGRSADPGGGPTVAGALSGGQQHRTDDLDGAAAPGQTPGGQQRGRGLAGSAAGAVRCQREHRPAQAPDPPGPSRRPDPQDPRAARSRTGQLARGQRPPGRVDVHDCDHSTSPSAPARACRPDCRAGNGRTRVASSTAHRRPATPAAQRIPPARCVTVHTNPGPPPRPFPGRTRLVRTTASHTTSPTDTPHTFFSMTRWAPPSVALNTRPPGRQRGNLHRESSIPVVHRSASGRDRILGTWQATRVWRRLRHR